MTLSQAAFERAVRRLGEADTHEFVAGLLDARGYRTAVEGPVVTATRDAGESGGLDTPEHAGPNRSAGPVRFLVVDRSAAVAAVETHRVDAVVVTGGPHLVATVAAVARTDRWGAAATPLVGIETLYEWFAYAVDSEARGVLAETYLGATGPSAFERGRSALVDALGSVTARFGRLLSPRPSGRVAGVVLLAVVALVAATTAGPTGLLASTGGTMGDGGTPTPPLTAVPPVATPAPATPERPVLPDACPSPPIDAHPASFRPGVIRTASADGLEGWRLLVTQNLTEYEFDPNDQQLGSVPTVRHVSVFESPAGARLRLGLDRWESPAQAGTAIARGGPWSLGFPWGTYGVWVEWEAEGEPAARELLAAVETPAGVGLGGPCVSALVTATSNATATSATA